MCNRFGYLAPVARLVDEFITTAPGPDRAPYHNRQPVILKRDQWATWLNLTADPTDLLRAGPAGTKAVERAMEAAA